MPSFEQGARVVALVDITQPFGVVAPRGTLGTVLGGGGPGPTYAIASPATQWEVQWDNGGRCYASEWDITATDEQ